MACTDVNVNVMYRAYGLLCEYMTKALLQLLRFFLFEVER